MAFGQQAGPPATARQVEELRVLLAEAGHVDFRDARGPMGFNQRQANGRFTRDEADAFIAQLQAEAELMADPGVAAQPTVPSRSAASSPPTAHARVQPKASKLATNLQRVPSEVLAAELQLRGWIVVEP